jgi:hypothetical protein
MAMTAASAADDHVAFDVNDQDATREDDDEDNQDKDPLEEGGSADGSEDEPPPRGSAWTVARRSTAMLLDRASVAVGVFYNILASKGSGSTLRTWRKVFDYNMKGSVAFMEFCNALHNLDYDDDAVKLWSDLDEDKSNRVEYEEVDPTAEAAMQEFMALVEESGGPLKFFTLIDKKQELKMSSADFATALAEVGFEPDAEYIIGGLDLDNIGEVTPLDMSFMIPEGPERKWFSRMIEKKRLDIIALQFGEAPPEEPSKAAEMLMKLHSKMGILSGSDWTMSKFAYEALPEPPPEPKIPSWIKNLEAVASVSLSSAGDRHFIDEQMWYNEMQEKLAAITEQEKLLPQRRVKPEVPKLPEIKPRKRVKKIELPPRRKIQLPPTPKPMELYGPIPFKLPTVASERSLRAQRSQSSKFASIETNSLKAPTKVNLLMAATQDAFLQYYGSQSAMSSLSYSKSMPSLRSLRDEP